MLRGRKIGQIVALLIVGVTAWQCALRPLLRSVPEGSSLDLGHWLIPTVHLELPEFDLATEDVHEWGVRFVDFRGGRPIISLKVSREDEPLAYWKLPVWVEMEISNVFGRVEFAHSGWLQDRWWREFSRDSGDWWQCHETIGVIYWPPQWDSQYSTKQSEEFYARGQMSADLSASFTVRVAVKIDAEADMELLKGVQARVSLERGFP